MLTSELDKSLNLKKAGFQRILNELVGYLF